jgi:hypothetical protein
MGLEKLKNVAGFAGLMINLAWLEKLAAGRNHKPPDSQNQNHNQIISSTRERRPPVL